MSKSHCIIGVDANAVLGCHNEYDIPYIIGQFGIGNRNERGDQFAAFVHANKLTVANTMFRKQADHLWTHQSWANGVRRQIDYLLVSPELRCQLRNVTLSNLHEKSDHRQMSVVLKGLVQSGQKDRRREAPAKTHNWQFLDDDSNSTARFNKILQTSLKEVLRGDAHALASTIVSAAVECQKELPQKTHGESEYIRSLRQARRGASSRAERDNISKQLLKALGHQRRARRASKMEQVIEKGGGWKEIQGWRKHQKYDNALSRRRRQTVQYTPIPKVLQKYSRTSMKDCTQPPRLAIGGKRSIGQRFQQ